MSYSSQLSFFLDRLSGFSTNIFRLEPQNATTASPNQIVRVTLPSNALLNLRSFAMHFTATTSSGANSIARLPDGIESLIDRVEVSCGGVQLSAGANYYNVLCKAKKALMDKHSDPVLGHPEIVRAKSYVDATDFAAADETYTGTNSVFCIDSWEGFLGTAEPKVMDSSLVPDIVVSLYLADTNVLANCRGTALSGTGTEDIDDPGLATVSYSLSNIHFTIECMGLQDATYDNMVSSMIASKGFLEIPFKQYHSFQDVHSGQMRFSVATQSLDRIWAVQRDSDYINSVGAVRISGYKTAGGFTATASAGSPTQDLGRPQFDIGGVLDYNKEKYTTAYSNFPEATANSTYQFQLNGAYIPQFKASFEEMSQISQNSIVGRPQKSHTLETMKKNYAVQCLRLNLPDSEFSRTISGLNTRSVSLNGYYNITGLGNNTPTVNLFCETTATLMVGAGRSLSVEQ